jgi:protein Mpv17
MYNRVFPLMFGAEKTMSNIVKMTLFDGFINAPFLWLPPAYIIQAVLYGYPKREALKKYVKDVRENGLLTKYWSLWLPVSFLNFSIVPPHYRIVFVAVVSFFWMIILSVAASKDQQDPESCPVEEEPVLKNPRALD